MSEDDKPTDLIEFKLRKSETSNKIRTHNQISLENGDCFQFVHQHFIDEDIGTIDDSEMPVIVLTPGFGHAVGLQMSVEDAEKLGVALIQAAGTVRVERARSEDKGAG